MQNRPTGMRLTRPKNNIYRINSIGSKNRTDRGTDAAANSVAVEIIHGVNTQPAQVSASAS